jgi:hypothetical protein
MRTALLVAGGLLAAAFAAAFGATFFARGHITRLAEDYVIDRTQKYADPLIGLAEEGLRLPGKKPVGRDAEAVEALRADVAEYRRDPRAYITRLVAAGGAPAVAEPGPNAAPKDQLLFWKTEVRAYFEKILDRLLFDLRIFTGSNLAAALAIFGLALAGRRDRLPRLLWAAGLLLLSLAFMTYMYIDELSYFKILLNSYMGWWYPVLLFFTFVGAYVEHGRPPWEPKGRVTGDE